MGLGDFLGGVADAVVPEAVEDVAGGIVHGAETLAGTVGTVAQGAAWAANPTHWDDIGRGVGAVGSFIGEHPGQAWDMAFEVGRHMVKEEILDPQHLAINLGMLAATTLTGGGAGAAWLAKLGTGARAGMGALRAARIAEEGGGLVRAGRAASTAMRASEAAWQAARAERAAAGAVTAGEAATEAAGLFGRAANKVTDVAEFMPRQIARAREYVTGSPIGKVAEWRGAAAEAFQGSTPSIAREMVGDVIRGSVFRPTAVGAGARAERFAQGAYAVHRGETNLGHVQAVESAGKYGEEVYQFKKNPEAYVAKKAGIAGADVEALRAGYQMVRQGKKIKKLMEDNETEPKKKATVSGPGMVDYSMPSMPTSSFARQGAQRSLGTSEEQYVESDFAVPDRLDKFYSGMYQDQSIYDTAEGR